MSSTRTILGGRQVKEYENSLEYAKKAYELNPNVPTAAFAYGTELAFRGYGDEAVALIDRAMALDPLNENYPFFGATSLVGAKRWADVVRYARQAISMNVASVELLSDAAYAAYKMGDDAQATEFVQLARNSSRQNNLVPLMVTYKILGRDADLAVVIEEIKARDAAMPLPDLMWFFIHLAVDEIDPALDRLERAVPLGFPAQGIKFVTLRPDHEFLDPVRDNPRFQAIIKSANRGGGK